MSLIIMFMYIRWVISYSSFPLLKSISWQWEYGMGLADLQVVAGNRKRPELLEMEEVEVEFQVGYVEVVGVMYD